MSSSTLITAIDAQLAILIADPTKIADWQEGDVKFNASQMIRELRMLRKQLLDGQDADISIMEFAPNIRQFG